MRLKHAPHAASSSPTASWIETHLPDMGSVVEERSLGSSSWSSSSTLTTSLGTRLFVKTSRQVDDTMFKGEALGLRAMEGTHGCDKGNTCMHAWYTTTASHLNVSILQPFSLSIYYHEILSFTKPFPACTFGPFIDTGAVRVPHVHAYGAFPGGRGSFIIMEALDLRGSPDQAALGRAMAHMHLAAPKVGS